MDEDKLSREIAEGTRQAGKSYAFDEAHDERQPTQWWFQESPEGLILFVIFYTLACRWSRCLGCNLPSRMSRKHVGYQALMAQVDHLLAVPEVARQSPEIRKVIVSNNGSVLDQETFSSTALLYLLSRLNSRLPALRVLTLETRPEYVEWAELEFISRALREKAPPAVLELAVGFEAFDDGVRNRFFGKGLALETFERLAKGAAPYGFRIKCYFMQKPVPDFDDEAAIADIHRGIDYLARLASRHRVGFNLHLNPTYVARGTRLARDFAAGIYVPPRLRDVARAVLHARGKNLSVFLGLSDEGMAVPGGSFLRPGEEELVRRLEEFNRTQDFAILETVCRNG